MQKIKVIKLQNANSFGSIITTLFYLPMATNIIPSKWSQTISLYEDIMSKPSHTPLFKLLTTHRRQSCWGGKGGTGWSEEKRGTLHMQNKSGGGGSVLHHYGRNHTRTCYMRLRTLAQLHRNRHRRDPGAPRKQKQEQKTRGAEVRKDGGNGTETRNISFADREWT